MNEKDVRAGTFGARLRSLRAARGLTQTNLARLTKLHHSTIAYFEHGRCRPSGASIVALSKALEVSVPLLLESTEDVADSIWMNRIAPRATEHSSHSRPHEETGTGVHSV